MACENCNDKKEATVNVSTTDWASVAFVLCVFGLIVLCAGTPDLLDAIIARVARG